MSWNPGVNLMHRPRWPEMNFSSLGNIGSDGNTHYTRTRLLEDTYSFTSECTDSPAYTQSNRYGATLLSVGGRWPANADTTFIGRTLETYYQWRITSLSNMTYAGGTMTVNTWYDFTPAGSYQTMNFGYVGGGNGSYTIQVRRKDTLEQVANILKTIVEP